MMEFCPKIDIIEPYVSKLIKLFEKTMHGRFYIDIDQLLPLDAYIQTELEAFDVEISDIERIQFEFLDGRSDGGYVLVVMISYDSDEFDDSVHILIPEKDFESYLKSMLINYRKGSGKFDAISEDKYNFVFKNKTELKKRLDEFEF